MDRASIIAIEEVCKRCHLYTKHCGMLEYPSQCVRSGHFIDGYRKAEKDLALTINDLELLHTFLYAVKNNKQGAFTFTRLSDEQYQEVLKRFKKMRYEK